MARKSAALHVYVGERKAGVYTRAGNGAIAFRYHDSWLGFHRAFPISLSLPLSARKWTGEAVQRVFDGLLPDAHGTREALAAHTGAKSAGIFDLLEQIGRDCVGAYRFLRPDEDPGDVTTMRARPLRNVDIAGRIAALGQCPLGIAPLASGDEDFRISISGNQDKTALLQIGNQWHLPLGSTPTSHIFKPSLPPRNDGVDMSDSPWNEWFCLNLCHAFGLAAAKAEISHFNGRSVLVVERFDRRWQDGVLYRLAQEDLCQALGVSPPAKYEAEGGPGIPRILNLLQQSSDPKADRLTFLKTQIVYWILSATDGHAKNFSIFLGPGGFSLTPAYDVISTAPYHPKIAQQKIKLAMPVGRNRHYRVNEILPRHFYQTAQSAGIEKADMDSLFESIEISAHSALQDATTAAEKVNMPSHTKDRIVETASSHIRLLRFAASKSALQEKPIISSADNEQPRGTPGFFS